MTRSLLLLALLLSIGCAAAPGPGGPGSGPVVLGAGQAGGEELPAQVPEELVPAFEAVRTALEEGEDLVARRALERLLPRVPEGPPRELALAYERVLDGRERCGWIERELVATEAPELGPARYRLELVLTNRGPAPLRLETAGARLVVRQVAVDEAGFDRRGSLRNGVELPGRLELAPDEPWRREVAALDLEPPAGVLAFSSVLRLALLPGEFAEPDGRYLPAQDLETPPVELVRLAGFLPSDPVPPEELARYVERGRLSTPALLERTVRILPARRDEALDLLTPLVPRLPRVEQELLVPALRWLAGTPRPGGSPESWLRWLESRAAARARGEEPDWDRLQVPGD